MRFCSHCGHPIREDQKVCTQCGTPIRRPVAPPPPPPPPPPIQRYEYKRKRRVPDWIWVILSLIIVFVITATALYFFGKYQTNPNKQANQISDAIQQKDAKRLQALLTNVTEKEANTYIEIVDKSGRINDVNKAIKSSTKKIISKKESKEDVNVDGITVMTIIKNGKQWWFFDNYDFKFPENIKNSLNKINENYQSNSDKTEDTSDNNSSNNKVNKATKSDESEDRNSDDSSEKNRSDDKKEKTNKSDSDNHSSEEVTRENVIDKVESYEGHKLDTHTYTYKEPTRIPEGWGFSILDKNGDLVGSYIVRHNGKVYKYDEHGELIGSGY